MGEVSVEGSPSTCLQTVTVLLGTTVILDRALSSKAAPKSLSGSTNVIRTLVLAASISWNASGRMIAAPHRVHLSPGLSSNIKRADSDRRSACRKPDFSGDDPGLFTSNGKGACLARWPQQLGSDARLLFCRSASTQPFWVWLIKMSCERHRPAVGRNKSCRAHSTAELSAHERAVSSSLYTSSRSTSVSLNRFLYPHLCPHRRRCKLLCVIFLGRPLGFLRAMAGVKRHVYHRVPQATSSDTAQASLGRDDIEEDASVVVLEVG